MQKNFMEDVIEDQSDKLYGIYRGVVEDRNDPEKQGRCKIRIFGIHSPLKVKKGFDGIPTEELPWAYPVTGLLEGSISGFGFWSVPLQGSHVMVFFENGHILQPRYFATVPGIPANTTFASDIDKAAADSYRNNAKAFKKGAKEAYEEIQNDPNAPEITNNNELGSISKGFESGNKGSGCISSGKGDYGGVSYGSYQFASFNGSRGNDCSVSQFVNTLPPEQRANFAGKTPGSPEYSAAWTKSVNEIGAEDFHKYEHNYIKQKHYDPVANRVKNKYGVDVSKRCAGVQDALWSVGVQHGPGTDSMFSRAGINDSMTDEEMIEAIYKERSRTDAYFSKCSPDVQQSVRKRYMKEVKMAQAKCKANPPANGEVPEEIKNATEEDLEKDTQLSEDEYKERYKEDAKENPEPQSDTGFTDPDGVLPSKKKSEEPDLHRISRGETKGTAIEHKEKKLDGKDKPIDNADKSSSWKEPAPGYKAEYPHNIVLATHGGIIIEIDSTPNEARFHLYHPSNSYVEINKDGTTIIRNNNDKFEIVMNNKHSHIHGDDLETIEQNRQIYVKGTETIKINEDQKETIDKNVERNIGINLKDSIGKDCNILIGKDETLEVGNNYTEKVGSNYKSTIGGSKEVNVSGTVNETSSGNYTITAPIIKLN